MTRRPRLVIPDGLEEHGFGVLDWRAVPRRVPVELLLAAARIARDGHTVAFTGHRYRTSPELTVDSRPTVTRNLSGHRNPVAAPPAEMLAAVLVGLQESARHIAVVCGQPELNEPDAAEAVTHWRRALPPDTVPNSIDIYGYDWTLHR
jgi:hypothetical protein